jgi:hypothetical protein
MIGATLMLAVLVALQAIQVVFLWIHDLVPLGRLNDIEAVRRTDSAARLTRTTLIQSVPYTIGLYFSVVGLSAGFPGWLWYWLWISYGLLFAGELRAWWWPYLVQPEPERAARYRVLFGSTHAFLPPRNGMAPNTLHLMLHACTALTLLVLAALTFWT